MTEKRYEESRLLALLSEDSQFAFQVLFDRYKDHIYKVASLYVKSPAMAEEIVQDVFMKVWLNRKSLTGVESFEAWLFVVSKNLIFNYNKRLALEWKACRKYQEQAPAPDNSADRKVSSAQYAALLQKAISELSGQQKTVYLLAREENLSYQEIGERLNISALTVKTHMARALNAIRSYLKQHGEILPILLYCLYNW